MFSIILALAQGETHWYNGSVYVRFGGVETPVGSVRMWLEPYRASGRVFVKSCPFGFFEVYRYGGKPNYSGAWFYLNRMDFVPIEMKIIEERGYKIWQMGPYWSPLRSEQ